MTKQYDNPPELTIDLDKKYSATLDTNHGEIVMDLQEQGIAAPSTTTLKGDFAIRVNITNHRTTVSDLDILIDAIVAAGRAISSGELSAETSSR